MASSSLAHNWQYIIQQEIATGTDSEYLQHLTHFKVKKGLTYTEPRPDLRPSALVVEAALRQAYPQTNHKVQKVWAEPLQRLDAVLKTLEFSDTLIQDLQSPAWVNRFVARHALVAIGGQAADPLQTLFIETDEYSSLRTTIPWLLKSIEIDTTARLASHIDKLLCPHCLTRCTPHRVRLPWVTSFSYYACRICHKSYNLMIYELVTAIFYQQKEHLQEQQNQQLSINWLRYRALFDFDRIFIKQASDEDIERFVVQVGNDTDPARCNSYNTIPYSVSPVCHLSQNTHRLLARMFGPNNSETNTSQFDLMT